MDLCSLKSAQLRSGRFVFPTDLTKGWKERAVPLPAGLLQALEAFKGETWLRQEYLPFLRATITAKGWPTHQLMHEFSPQRLDFWVETFFADYNKAFPDRSPLTTHWSIRSWARSWPATGCAGSSIRPSSPPTSCSAARVS